MWWWVLTRYRIGFFGTSFFAAAITAFDRSSLCPPSMTTMYGLKSTTRLAYPPETR